MAMIDGRSVLASYSTSPAGRLRQFCRQERDFSAGDRGTESEKRLETIARNGQKRGLLVRRL
jgi:hypothetical protein